MGYFYTEFIDKSMVIMTKDQKNLQCNSGVDAGKNWLRASQKVKDNAEWK